jgi:hypothetical protein
VRQISLFVVMQGFLHNHNAINFEIFVYKFAHITLQIWNKSNYETKILWIKYLRFSFERLFDTIKATSILKYFKYIIFVSLSTNVFKLLFVVLVSTIDCTVATCQFHSIFFVGKKFALWQSWQLRLVESKSLAKHFETFFKDFFDCNFSMLIKTIEYFSSRQKSFF